MLDAKIYKLAFVPAVFVALLAAFSFKSCPVPLTSKKSTEAFDSQRVSGHSNGQFTKNSISELVQAFPHPRAGTLNERALSHRIAEQYRANGFQVSTIKTRGREAIVGTRPGLLENRIVVLSRHDQGGKSGLSATAVQIELARVLELREQQGTIVLVSTSSSAQGCCLDDRLREAVTRGSKVELVIVLGNLTALSKSIDPTVSWSNGSRPLALPVQRTIDAAVERESGRPIPESSLLDQLGRRAIPIATHYQGLFLRSGIPAVLIQGSGERDRSDERDVSLIRASEFGRTVLRVITTIDDALAERRSPKGRNNVFDLDVDGLVIGHKYLPDQIFDWFIFALLLPTVGAIADISLRIRRRGIPIGRWLLWLLGLGLAVFSAYLVLLVTVALGLQTPTGVDRPRFGLAEMLCGVITIATFAGAYCLHREWAIDVLRLRRGAPGAAGTVAVATLIASVLGLFVVNPYTAALLLPACHCWIAALASRGQAPQRVGLLAVVLTVAPFVGAGVIVANQLGLGASAFLALIVGAIADGHIPFLAGLCICLLLTSLVALMAMIFRKRLDSRDGVDSVQTRGPLRHAGPGALGGTESALR